MDELVRMAKELVASEGLPFRLELDGKRVVATFAAGGQEATRRRQKVRLAQTGNEYVLSSTVCSAKEMPSGGKGRAELLRALWRRNANTQIVAFGIDKKGRLVGRCRHPVGTLDLDELKTYVVALARECDRLEWVLGGRDRY